MVVNVFEVEPNSMSPWAAILASLFAQANDWELAFQIWKLSSLLYPVLFRDQWGKTTAGKLNKYGGRSKYV